MPLKKSLKKFVESPESPAGRAFDLMIQFLIVVSLVAYSIDTLPDLSSRSRDILRWIEFVTVLIFTGEYLLRLIAADRKLKFIFSFFGLVDLFAILPFYLSAGMVDARSLRAMRLLRVFRVLKLARYSAAIQRIHRALLIAKEELILFFFAAVVIIFLAAVGIHYFESEVQPELFASVFHSLWWAVATLTTVGYGDVYPMTVGGRIFTFCILLVGLGFISVPAGLFASALSEARKME